MKIVVGGLGRKVGKTALVCRIIALTKEMRWTAVKVSHHQAGGGGAYELIEEKEAGSSGDTRRYLAAGAARAYWLRGDFEKGLNELKRVLGGAGNWVVESTRAVGRLDHDCALIAVDAARIDDDKLRGLLGVERKQQSDRKT